MDRLSLWQLMDSLTPSDSSSGPLSQPKAKDQKDWMQIYCEDVVEPLCVTTRYEMIFNYNISPRFFGRFRDRVPEMCDLLRTKVFPHRLFSEDSDSAPSPPPILPTKKVKTNSTHPPSPLRLQEIGKPQAARSRAGSTHPSVTPTDSRASGAPKRHRSRSRSVSVSVEAVRARGANRGGVASSKSLWKGEVEMKRTSSRGSKLFKPSPVEDRKGKGGEMTYGGF